MATEEQYPYKSIYGADYKCLEDSVGASITTTGYTNITVNSPYELSKALLGGPITIGMEARGQQVRFYKSGIISQRCGTDLDHAVLLVGYGTNDQGVSYWILKNSWGVFWGEQGYFRVLRDLSKEGTPGVCGIYMEPSFPLF